MNLYLSAIGFSDMDSMKESRFIKAAVRQCIDEGYILKNESLKRGVAVVRVSESAGIYIFGRYEGKKFVYEYYYPFIIGNKISENDELTIERHVDKESYSIVCDESRTGVTLIFYLQNVMDYMNYVTSRPDYIKGSFNPDTRNAIAKCPIKNTTVVLSALSLGGMILLPIDKNSRKSAKNT